VYVTYFGTGTLSVISESQDTIEISNSTMEMISSLIVVIAVGIVVVAIFMKKRQARLSKTQN